MTTPTAPDTKEEAEALVTAILNLRRIKCRYTGTISKANTAHHAEFRKE